MISTGSSQDELRIHVISLRFARAEHAFIHKIDVAVKGPLSPVSNVFRCSFDRQVNSIGSYTHRILGKGKTDRMAKGSMGCTPEAKARRLLLPQ